MREIRHHLPTRHYLELPNLARPTVTPGYVRNPDETRAARAPDGWLRTGDLGYLAGGELYLLGRRKDVIIVRGRNLYAHDVRVVAPGTLPKTSSGKLQRGEMRERYLAGRLSARRRRIATGAVLLRSWLGHLGPRRRRRT